ncbi:23S rRNA pseudoU1915 N3-methylase RlmH [Paenibacillus mucilaginosus]
MKFSIKEIYLRLGSIAWCSLMTGKLALIKPDKNVFVLAIGGELWSSENLAAQLDKLGTTARVTSCSSSAARTGYRRRCCAARSRN